jgi:general secretion pathway protein A
MRCNGETHSRDAVQQAEETLQAGVTVAEMPAYVRHFGLKDHPFRCLADTPYFYPAAGHEIALARLHRSVSSDEGFAVLVGDTGLGKTLLLHRMLARLPGRHQVLLATHAHFSHPAALFQTLLFDMGLPYEGRSEHELRLCFIEQALKAFQSGRPMLVILDEAHHVTPQILEELRLLSNLETQTRKVVQAVLAGQPLLAELLHRPGMAALRQRVRTVVHLPSLDVHESADYLAHRIKAVGGRPEQVFTEEALEVLSTSCRGIPRLLNYVADVALSLAAEAKAPRADAEAAIEAVRELGLGERQEEVPAKAAAGGADSVSRSAGDDSGGRSPRSKRLFTIGTGPAGQRRHES